ncbi:MAG: VOC family protein [Candidatus Nitrosocosmicus sp.]|nr:VOC family protein [Candidatus Nitrosocosmicus sp.]
MRELDPFPPGYHTVNPYLVIGNVSEFIKFSELVFNAVVVKRIEEEKGFYAEVKIGDTYIMLEENRKSSHPCSLSLWIYVRDVEITYDKALKAGCKSIQTPTHMYEVDKLGKILDPFGITWLIATFNSNI